MVFIQHALLQVSGQLWPIGHNLKIRAFAASSVTKYRRKYVGVLRARVHESLPSSRELRAQRLQLEEQVAATKNLHKLRISICASFLIEPGECKKNRGLTQKSSPSSMDEYHSTFLL